MRQVREGLAKIQAEERGPATQELSGVPDIGRHSEANDTLAATRTARESTKGRVAIDLGPVSAIAVCMTNMRDFPRVKRRRLWADSIGSLAQNCKGLETFSSAVEQPRHAA